MSGIPGIPVIGHRYYDPRNLLLSALISNECCKLWECLSAIINHKNCILTLTCLPPFSLPLLLLITSGYVDAVGYEELKGIFTSSITGNLIVAAISVVTLTGLLTRALVVLAFFFCSGLGAYIAICLRSTDQYAATTIALVLFFCEIAFITLSIIAGNQLLFYVANTDDRDSWYVCFVAVLVAGGMGFQNIAVKESIRDAPSTTVMTACLVTVAQNASYALAHYCSLHGCTRLEPKDKGELSNGDSVAIIQAGLSVWLLKLGISVKPLIMFITGAIIGALVSYYTRFWSLVVPFFLVLFIMIDIGLQGVHNREAELTQIHSHGHNGPWTGYKFQILGPSLSGPESESKDAIADEFGGFGFSGGHDSDSNTPKFVDDVILELRDEQVDTSQEDVEVENLARSMRYRDRSGSNRVHSV